jgi:phosphoserine phosphatase
MHEKSMTNAALASWVDGAAKRAITEFVERVTTPGAASFVPPAERIAVFDNDGVLWCEKPMPIELGFILQRLEVMAQQDVSLRNRQPWQAAYDHDFAWLGQAITKHYQGDESDVKLLMAGVIQAFAGKTVDEYESAAAIFLHQGKHPTLGRALTDCGYLPMVELLRYLEAHGFTNFIASAGDRDFMRTVTQELYGVPVDRVMGSSNALRYRDTENGGTVVYLAEPDVFDDGPAKPVRIWSRIGRRPIIAVGNSNGDIPMLRFAGGGSISALRIVILHDDPAREFDYVTGAERALQLAKTQRWTVVSMKNDWSLVFAASKIKKERRAPTSAA